MSGFTCEQPHDLGLMGNDVHILGYTCNNQWGAFISVLVGTLVIKLAQNKLWAEQAQKQRELLQLPKKERWGKNTWSSPMAKMLLLEFISTVIGIISVLVIMGANFWIFLVIIFSNLSGTAWTYARMEMDHHSTATDIINMVKLIDADNIENSNQKNVNTESAKKAREAIAMLKRALRDSVPLPIAPAIPVKNRRAQRGFVF